MFFEPAPCSKKYHLGNSWREILNISSSEFKATFEEIGRLYISLTEYQMACAAGEPFDCKFYLAILAEDCKSAWYLRNHALVESVLESVALGQPPSWTECSALEALK